MTMHRSENRRRNYFIKKTFQVRFILKFCLLVILTAVISAFVIYRFSGQSITTVFENSRLIIKPSSEFIMPGLILSALVSVILVGTATILVVLFVSHRIAGPLYKVESSLEKLGRGDVSFNIHLRKSDETKKLSEAFNEASKGLNVLLKDVRRESDDIRAVMEELNLLAKKMPIDHSALKKTIKKSEAINTRLSENLKKFRLR